MDRTDEKYLRLREYLRSLGSVAVAFSGGVDSTFLLRAAHGKLKSFGFSYVTLDLLGYRTGSMNETLTGTVSGS